MFFKTRMRASLRAILADAARQAADPVPVPDLALRLERQAIARGVAWRGLSARQAALVIIHDARLAAGLGSLEAQRLEAAALRHAAVHGLAGFCATLAADVGRIEHDAALRRQGHLPGAAPCHAD